MEVDHSRGNFGMAEKLLGFFQGSAAEKVERTGGMTEGVGG